MSETTNVVVLGVGLAGSALVTSLVSLTKKLPQVDITVVDVRNSSILKYAGTRSAVLGDKYAYRACIPNSSLVPTGKGRVINKMVTGVDEVKKEVHLEDDKTLRYDILVCATGAVNVSPCEPPLLYRSVVDQVDYYSMIANQIERANRILILGSGAVGTELAGEIKSQFSNKQVAILSPGTTLVDGCFPPPSPKFFSKLEAQARSLGIELYLGQKARSISLNDFQGQPFLAGDRTVVTTGEQSIRTELILICTGKKLNNEIYPQSWKNAEGLLKVRQSLQILGNDDVFAIGDINDVDENKQGYFAQKQGNIVAKNIDILLRSRLKGKNPPALKVYKPGSKTQIIIPLGRKVGTSFLGGIVLGSKFTSEIKGKDLFVKQHWALYEQKKLLIKENDPGWLDKAEKTYPSPGRPGANMKSTNEAKNKGSFVPELEGEFRDVLSMGQSSRNVPTKVTFGTIKNTNTMKGNAFNKFPDEDEEGGGEAAFNGRNSYKQIMEAAEQNDETNEFSENIVKFGFNSPEISNAMLMSNLSIGAEMNPNAGTETMKKKKKKKRKHKHKSKGKNRREGEELPGEENNMNRSTKADMNFDGNNSDTNLNM